MFSNLSTPVKNVCVDGNILKTITPLKSCTKVEVKEVCEKIGTKGAEECRPVRKGEVLKETFGKRLVYDCVATVDKNVETSKFHEVPACLNWEQTNDGNHEQQSWVCTKWGTETKEYADTYSISVTKSGNVSKQSDMPEINLDFEIPVCK